MPKNKKDNKEVTEKLQQYNIDPAFSVTFGRNVRAIRKARGLNQKQLAEMTACSTSTIGSIENGKKSSVSVVELLLLSAALETPIDTLLRDIIEVQGELSEGETRIARYLDTLDTAELNRLQEISLQVAQDIKYQ